MVVTTRRSSTKEIVTVSSQDKQDDNEDNINDDVIGDDIVDDDDVFPSILELKKSLPPHCFQPSLPRSLLYVVKDLVIVAAIYALFVYLTESSSSSTLMTVFVYPIYWFLQGTMMWAIFVLGHDCGHGSFSSHPLINDIVGNVLHAFILVPYFPWKLSHKHHHKNTANIDKDEIFYPIRERDREKGCMDFIPLFGFGTSWFLYLVKGYAPRAANHLNPMDPFFAKQAMQCATSLACCSAWISFGLIPFATSYGLTRLALHYLVPVFVFGSWLVVTTFLHHQDEGVPWYADHKWNYVKGNLSSVDRDYGWAHTLVHNIGTHQVHHLFSKIPHYYLEEATEVFRKKYPHLVRVSYDPILPAFRKRFRIFNAQQWIKDETEVHVFRDEK